jgi:hypothetical protein
MRGQIGLTKYNAECDLVRKYLKASGKDYLVEFEKAWLLDAEGH